MWSTPRKHWFLYEHAAHTNRCYIRVYVCVCVRIVVIVVVIVASGLRFDVLCVVKIHVNNMTRYESWLSSQPRRIYTRRCVRVSPESYKTEWRRCPTDLHTAAGRLAPSCWMINRCAKVTDCRKLLLQPTTRRTHPYRRRYI